MYIYNIHSGGVPFEGERTSVVLQKDMIRSVKEYVSHCKRASMEMGMVVDGGVYTIDCWSSSAM